MCLGASGRPCSGRGAEARGSPCVIWHDRPVDFFEDEDYYTGPPVTDIAIQAAQRALGYRLPQAYLALLRQRNGGTPRHGCFPTRSANSWAPDHSASPAYWA